jgi:antitoxin (DNA-binding transcriptional repressor) of toxin-antitoxin stability system
MLAADNTDVRPGYKMNCGKLTGDQICDTMSHMKKISIRELHEKTGAWVRQVARYGEIDVTDRGVPVARLMPQVREAEVPYFLHRKLMPGFRDLQKSGRLRRGTDSTRIISEDRERRAQ